METTNRGIVKYIMGHPYHEHQATIMYNFIHVDMEGYPRNIVEGEKGRKIV